MSSLVKKDQSGPSWLGQINVACVTQFLLSYCTSWFAYYAESHVLYFRQRFRERILQVF